MPHSSPCLIVGLDGPIVLDARTGARGLTLAAYAKPFLWWATAQFSVIWLSRRGPSPAFAAAAALGLPADAIPVASFRYARTEAVARSPGAIWMDSALTQAERDWVMEHGRRFVEVDPQRGVTPAHRAELMRFKT